MLVLMRRLQEAVLIKLPDGRVGRITVTDVDYQKRVRIGFEFPKDVDIRRSEIAPYLFGEDSNAKSETQVSPPVPEGDRSGPASGG